MVILSALNRLSITSEPGSPVQLVIMTGRPPLSLVLLLAKITTSRLVLCHLEAVIILSSINGFVHTMIIPSYHLCTVSTDIGRNTNLVPNVLLEVR